MIWGSSLGILKPQPIYVLHSKQFLCHHLLVETRRNSSLLGRAFIHDLKIVGDGFHLWLPSISYIHKEKLLSNLYPYAGALGRIKGVLKEFVFLGLIKFVFHFIKMLTSHNTT
ncbi:PREDICTED: uncharacterized protein LOC101304263 [Fragaria vesca subsp. vesca]